MATSKQDAEKRPATHGKNLDDFNRRSCERSVQYFIVGLSMRNAGPDIKYILATWVFSTDFTSWADSGRQFSRLYFFSLYGQTAIIAERCYVSSWNLSYVFEISWNLSYVCEIAARECI